MTIIKFKPLTDNPDQLGFVTPDGMWAAVPYGDKKFIIIHNGQQVHTALSIETAKSFIYKQTKKNRKS
jgi:hypothetical protein